MVSDFNYWSNVVKRFFSLALTVLLLYLVLKLSIFYLPFLIAFALALLIEPAIRLLMKKLKWTRRISSVFVMIIAVLIILSIIGWGFTTLFNEASNLLDGVDTYFQKIKDFVNNIASNDYLKDKLPDELRTSIENAETEYIHYINNLIVNILTNIKNWISKVPNLLTTFFFVIAALYFICTDKIYMIDQVEHHLPDNWSRKLIMHVREITKKLGNYMKAEAILVFISFVISLIGLTTIKLFGLNVQYPLISAIGIGFVDALPILGSGTAMIPWAVIEALNGDITLGIALIALWTIMGITKNMLEPKLVSKNIGIHPVFTLIAMYTGYKIIGIIGMIVGPILLIVLKEIYTPIIDRGVLRSIFDRTS